MAPKTLPWQKKVEKTEDNTENHGAENIRCEFETTIRNEEILRQTQNTQNNCFEMAMGGACRKKSLKMDIQINLLEIKGEEWGDHKKDG